MLSVAVVTSSPIVAGDVVTEVSSRVEVRGSDVPFMGSEVPPLALGELLLGSGVVSVACSVVSIAGVVSSLLPSLVCTLDAVLRVASEEGRTEVESATVVPDDVIVVSSKVVSPDPSLTDTVVDKSTAAVVVPCGELFSSSSWLVVISSDQIISIVVLSTGTSLLLSVVSVERAIVLAPSGVDVAVVVVSIPLVEAADEIIAGVLLTGSSVTVFVESLVAASVTGSLCPVLVSVDCSFGSFSSPSGVDFSSEGPTDVL